MNFLKLYKIILFGNSSLRKSNKVKILIISTFALLIILTVLGEYFGFRNFFNILNDFDGIKPVIISYTLNSLFLILFSIVTMSTIISNTVKQISKKDAQFALTLPLSGKTIYLAHSTKQLSTSLWTALIFGIPIILAYSTTQNKISFYPISITSYLILVFLAISLGSAVALFFQLITRHLSKYIKYTLTAIVLILIAYITLSIVAPKDIFSLLVADKADGNQEALLNIARNFSVSPSQWFTQSLIDNFSDYTIIYKLITLTFFIFLFQIIIAHLSYRHILQSVLESTEIYTVKPTVLTREKGLSLSILQEIFLIIRRKTDIAQFIFFVFLLFLYLGFLFQNRSLKNNIDLIWTPRLVTFIIITLSYFIILIALRYIFPLPSIEKDNSWFNLTLPYIRKNTYKARLLAITLPTIIIIEIIVLLTAEYLHLNKGFTFPLALLTPFLVFTITNICLYFGTIFTIKEKTSAEAISTTIPGLLTFLSCSLFSTIIAFLLFKESQSAASAGFIGLTPNKYYLSSLVISVILSLTFWLIGQKKYQKNYLT